MRSDDTKTRKHHDGMKTRKRHDGTRKRKLDDGIKTRKIHDGNKTRRHQDSQREDGQHGRERGVTDLSSPRAQVEGTEPSSRPPRRWLRRDLRSGPRALHGATALK